MHNDKLLIAGGDKRLREYDIIKDELTIVKEFDGRYLMGITKSDDYLYVSTDSTVYKLDFDYNIIKEKIVDTNAVLDIHHIKYTNNQLFVPATVINGVYILNPDTLDLQRLILIAPPDPTNKIFRKLNYNHLNSICFYRNHYFVNLNWLTQTQFSWSGVAVLDSAFNEIVRFRYGWQTHCFTTVDGFKLVLCGYDKNVKVNHPEYGGLMIEGNMGYKTDGTWFSKNFSMGVDKTYIVSSRCSKREERHKSDSKITILDNEWNVIKEKEFKGVGEFKGCLLNNIDFTDN